MPIYEYQCVACGTVTDIKHGFKETAAEACPKCGGIELKRLFNAAGIVFKGSGFYVTDSRKASDSGAAKPAAASKPDAASKNDGAPKTDSSSKSDVPATSDSSAKKDAPATSDSGGKGDAAA